MTDRLLVAKENYKLWFEAILFDGRRTVLSTTLAWFSRKSAHIRTPDKLKFKENVWKPGKLFDFLLSVECSNSNRHFVWNWLTVKDFPG